MTDVDRTVYCQQGPDELLPAGLGDLTGLQFVFKDLFDVKGYVTGAGNPTWLATHSPAESTSPLITALLSQGAECVGRVQTDELAYSLNGQNVHYGTPVNPKAEDCIPGGSSSGSAVAVARGEADFAIGTDTGGSVRVPASYCGIYGLRPTLGKFSLDNAFELAESFDTAGLFARQLPVLKKAYQALANTNVDIRSDVLNVVSSLKGPQYLSRIERVTEAAAQPGLSVCEVDDKGLFSDFAVLSELFRTIQGFEIIQGHAEWLDEHEEALDPAIAERVHWARTITPEQYDQGIQKQAEFRESLIVLLKECGGSILLPTTPAGPPKLATTAGELAEYRSQLMGLTAIAGLSGCPQLHIPVLDQPEGPCGISILGLPDSEQSLINMALLLVNDKEGL
ncbi:amidase family protein [Vibrio albus]|nr:amidase family protein [Vibrio albus]